MASVPESGGTPARRRARTAPAALAELPGRAQSAVGWTDGGGRAPLPGLRPVHGRDRVAALFMAVAASLPEDGLDVRYRRVAGDPCALVFSCDGPVAVVIVDLAPDGDRIAGVSSITNPDKLPRARR